MGTLSDDLRRLGYSRTEKESPFDDDGTLWSNGIELVCDETAMIIDMESPEVGGAGGDDSGDRDYFRYPNSERIRMIGGYFSSYNWGYDEDRFYY